MYSFVESITKDFLRWKCGRNDARRVEYLVERDVISEDLGVGSRSCGNFVTGCVCSSSATRNGFLPTTRRRNIKRGAEAFNALLEALDAASLFVERGRSPVVAAPPGVRRSTTTLGINAKQLGEFGAKRGRGCPNSRRWLGCSRGSCLCDCRWLPVRFREIVLVWPSGWSASVDHRRGGRLSGSLPGELGRKKARKGPSLGVETPPPSSRPMLVSPCSH